MITTNKNTLKMTTGEDLRWNRLGLQSNKMTEVEADRDMCTVVELLLLQPLRTWGVLKENILFVTAQSLVSLYQHSAYGTMVD